MLKKSILIAICAISINFSANAFFTEAWDGTCNFFSGAWESTCDGTLSAWNSTCNGTSSAYESSISWVDAERKDISTIIITSNYYKSRLLADIVQNRTGQPYILVPTEPNGKIFFCGSNPDIADLEIHPTNLMQFLTFVNPERIILLGDDSYVLPEYKNQVKSYYIPWIVGQDNWNLNADRIGAFFMDPTIATEYREIKGRLETVGGFYVPANPATKRRLQLKTPPSVKKTFKPLPVVTNTKPIKEESNIVVKKNIKTENAIIIIPEVTPKNIDDTLNEPQIILPSDDPILIK